MDNSPNVERLVFGSGRRVLDMEKRLMPTNNLLALWVFDFWDTSEERSLLFVVYEDFLNDCAVFARIHSCSLV